MGNLLSCIRPKEGEAPAAENKGSKRPNKRRNQTFREIQLSACVTEKKLPTTGNEKRQYEVSVSDKNCADDELPVAEEVLHKLEKAPSMQSTPRSVRKACSADISTQPEEHTTSVHMARGEPDDQTKEMILKALAKYSDGDGDADDAPAFNCDKDDEEFIHPSPTKIYHYNAEHWGNFSEYLEKAYTEQYGDDQSLLSSLSSRPDDDASVDEETDTSDDETDTSELDDEYTKAYDYVNHILERLIEHVEEIIVYREEYTGYGDDDSVATDDISIGRLTPPEIEGEIYCEMGILKKRLTHDNGDSPRRSISWGAGVKPPAADLCYLAIVSNDFMQERQKLLMKKHKNIELANLSCRPVNNRRGGLISQGGRIPTPAAIRPRIRPTTATKIPTIRPTTAIIRPTPAIIRPTTAKIRPTPVTIRPSPATIRPRPTPVTIRPTSLLERQTALPVRPTALPIRKPAVTIESYQTPVAGIIWPQRIEEVGNASAKKYFVEQFQKTWLYKQKLKDKQEGKSLWQRGLTPFQIWVVHNTGTVMLDKTTNTKPATTRVKTAKSRISCWRGPGPPGSR